MRKIGLYQEHIPYKWEEGLMSEQKIGGVMLVFLSGKNKTEINNKVKAIKNFCKILAPTKGGKERI